MQITKLPSLERQVGGSHYKNQNYELAQFSLDIGLNPMVHSAIKYVLRDKQDKAEDLDKAEHCLTIYRDWLLEMARTNPKRLYYESKGFDFNLVSTFISQFEAHQQAAMIAILQLQSDLQVQEVIEEDLWETIYKISEDLVQDNFNNAIEHIQRMK